MTARSQMSELANKWDDVGGSGPRELPLGKLEVAAPAP
jgi:hypothetical protein